MVTAPTGTAPVQSNQPPAHMLGPVADDSAVIEV